MIGRLAAAFRDLRLHRPWSFKAPFLISIPYFVIHVAGLDIAAATAAILASAVTILGIAGVAYLLNDFADREADLLGGKPNFFNGRSLWAALSLALACVALAVVPWLTVLPLTRRTAPWLGLELLLFAIYALPPLRLKDRGVLGMLTDSLYAHAVPAVLAALTIAEIGKVPDAVLLPYLTVLASWQFVLGLRNILLHQLLDREQDEVAGTRTWVTQVGAERGERLLRRLVAPAELTLYLAWIVLVAREVSIFLPGLLLFLLFTSWVIRVRWKQALPGDLRSFLFNYVDDFCCEWVPLLLLIQLAVDSPPFLAFLGLHLLLFPKNAGRRVWLELRPT